MLVSLENSPVDALQTSTSHEVVDRVINCLPALQSCGSQDVIHRPLCPAAGVQGCLYGLEDVPANMLPHLLSAMWATFCHSIGPRSIAAIKVIIIPAVKARITYSPTLSGFTAWRLLYSAQAARRRLQAALVSGKFSSVISPFPCSSKFNHLLPVSDHAALLLPRAAKKPSYLTTCSSIL